MDINERIKTGTPRRVFYLERSGYTKNEADIRKEQLKNEGFCVSISKLYDGSYAIYRCHKTKRYPNGYH